MEVLRKEGYSSVDIDNKVHYICNERIEREELDAAIDAVKDFADLASLESDGCPCMPTGENTDEWRARVLALMDDVVASTTHTWKPYRSTADLLEIMMSKFPDVPVEAWTQIDNNWEEIYDNLSGAILDAEMVKKARGEEMAELS